MPKIAKELKPAAVAALKHDGGKGHTFHAVGGVPGLLLQVTAGGGRSWIMRIRIDGARKHFGLGSYPIVPLGEARDRASDIKKAVGGKHKRLDPIEAWQMGSIVRDLLSKGSSIQEVWTQAREQWDAKLTAQTEAIAEVEAALNSYTFSEAVSDYLETDRIDELSNAKHKKQWRSTLETYACPFIGHKQVSEILDTDIINILKPIWNEKRETARRVRGRIETVLNSYESVQRRSGKNPASAEVLKYWTEQQRKVVKQKNQPALQLADAPAWWEALKKRDGISARALEFLTLCASRSGEVRGAEWSEFDLDAALWTIPGDRMKMKVEHRVPLSPEAVALLRGLDSLVGSTYVFPAARGGMLSDMSLSAVMKRMHETETKSGRTGWIDRQSKRPAVPHGLRSTFRDWAAEKTNHRRELAEAALAHKVGDAVEQAYQRGDMLDKRRLMMADWVKFLEGAA